MTARDIFFTFLGALVAAFGSAVIYFIVSLSDIRSEFPVFESLLWIVAVSLMLLPFTTFSSLVTRYSVQSAMKLMPVVNGAILVSTIGASTIGFVFYMNAHFPALTWKEVWWLPMIAAIIAVGVALLLARREKLQQ